MKTMNLLTMGMAILLLAAIAGFPVAQAHCNGKHQPPHEHCDDPGNGGGNPPTPINSYGWWVNDELPNAAWDVDLPLTDPDGNPDRECTPEHFQTAGNGGAYHCWHVVEKWPHAVTFDFSTVTSYGLSGKRGDAALCESFRNGLSIVADGLFNYTWEGNCKDQGGCLIRIINWFNGQQVTDAVDAAVPGATPVRRIVLNGLSQIQLGSAEDSNPFFVNRIIDVDTFDIDFVGVGTNKKVASCTYDMSSSLVPASFESVTRP